MLLKNINSGFYYFLLFLLCATITQSCNSQKNLPKTENQNVVSNSNEEAGSRSYYFVRHAEKLKESNPGLTKEGKERAIELSHLLSAKEISTIYSSDYNRTRQTAEPTARAKKITPIIYDAHDLDEFAKILLDQNVNGNSLIVGHSNSTPSLINILLGEERLVEIDHEVYDNLFVLTINKDGEKELLTLKYGKPSH